MSWNVYFQISVIIFRYKNNINIVLDIMSLSPIFCIPEDRNNLMNQIIILSTDFFILSALLSLPTDLIALIYIFFLS